MIRSVLRAGILALVVVLAVIYTTVHILAAFHFFQPVGATFDPPSGIVQSVAASSAAARAGIHAGDRVDFGRSGWMMHLWLDRGKLHPGQNLVMPLLRNGKPIAVTLVAQIPNGTRLDVLELIDAASIILYSLFGIALYLLRRSTASFVFMVFAAGYVMGVQNGDIYWLFSPAWSLLSLLIATALPAAITAGTLYFAFLFAAEPGRMRTAMRILLLTLVTPTILMYGYHFFAFALWPNQKYTYTIAAILVWTATLVSLVAITVRGARDSSAARRLRWVMVALWAQAILSGAFFLEQIFRSTTSFETTFLDLTIATFIPAVIGIGYALLRTRIIDVRLVGGKTLVYALLTALPIGLFSIADWFFGRRLADARLATIAEIIVAIFFGVTLNMVHRRIDLFVERTLFAARHRAFQQIRHTIHALPATSQSETVYEILATQSALALRLASAAVFVARGNTFERRSSIGWDDCARELSADDPLVLYARSSHRCIHLHDVAQTHCNAPKDDCKPDLAIPVLVQHAPLAVVLYGFHTNGEHIDEAEEALLIELAHSAGSALEHLQTGEQIRSLQAELEVFRAAHQVRV